MDNSFAPYVQITQPVERVFLWGMMGVGKTTYGKRLAFQLGWEWLDLDQVIESATSKSVHQIFEEDGEKAFRAFEAHHLRTLEHKRHCVISTGGGTPHIEGLADWMLEHGLCLWLDAPAKALAQRLEVAKVRRPLIDEHTGQALVRHLEKLISTREKSYKKAHMIVNVLKMKPRELALHIEAITRGRS